MDFADLGRCRSFSFGVVVLIFLFWAFLSIVAYLIEPRNEPSEPPRVKSRVPLIGHLWGLYQHGPQYFIYTSSKTRSPVHTLALLSGKIYIVSQPSIVNLVSRNAKSISWSPLIVEVGIRLTGASNKAREIIERNLDGSQGKDSYVVEIHDRSIAAMTPGPEMNRISSVMLKDACARFLKPIEDEVGPLRVSLYGFLRRLISVSSTAALYGPRNPILLDPSLEQTFWDFNANLNPLLMNVYPAITARKGHNARRRLAKAFKSYFDSNPVGQSSSLTEARYLIARKHGLDTLDIGHLEVGTLIGILENTVPTLFYLLIHIFMSSTLLADLRRELDENALTRTDEAVSKVVLNMSKVRSHCSLLNSTLQEVLRVYSEGASARFVTQDTEIDGRFILKKGNVLQIPNSVIHRDRKTWGDTSFEARRFMKDSDRFSEKIRLYASDGSKIKSSTSATSYRPFGGGSTVCPGRHFAAMELMGIAAIIIWRFELTPADGEKWTLPPTKQQSIVEAVWPPAHDVEVVVKNRKLANQSQLEQDWVTQFD